MAAWRSSSVFCSHVASGSSGRLWQVLHAEYGMVIFSTTGAAVGTGAVVLSGTGVTAAATSGSMILNVWLAPSWMSPRLSVVGGMWHCTHLPLWTLGEPCGTSMAPTPSIICFIG